MITDFIGLTLISDQSPTFPSVEYSVTSYCRTAQRCRPQSSTMATFCLWKKNPVLFTLKPFLFYHHVQIGHLEIHHALNHRRPPGLRVIMRMWAEHTAACAQPSRVQWNIYWGVMGAIGAQFVQHVARNRAVYLFDEKPLLRGKSRFYY